MLAAMSSHLLAEDYGYLVFTLNDGTTQNIVAQGTSLTFSNGNLTATNGTNTLTIPLADLKKMVFSNEGTSGIGNAGNAKALTDNVSEIYDLQGHKVGTQLSTLKKGVYIVKSASKTYKKIVK